MGAANARCGQAGLSQGPPVFQIPTCDPLPTPPHPPNPPPPTPPRCQMSDLIVIGYPDERRLKNVWELVKLERDYLVDLEDSRYHSATQGEAHITTPAQHAVAWGSFAAVWELLIGRSSC